MRSVALSSDGRLALTDCSQGVVRIWKIGSGRELWSFAVPRGVFRFSALSANGQFAYATSLDGVVSIWRVQTGQVLATVPFDSEPTRLALAQDDKTVLVGDGAGNLYAFRWVGIG